MTNSERIHRFLQQLIPEKTPLQRAMRYSLLNGGKRLRPLLVYASGEIFHANMTVLDHAAAAIECIHVYSLIHDDLPAMDDDDFRRDQPSCHKAFDEARAILDGDALQSLAFECLTKPLGILAEQQLAMQQTLAQAAGMNGMVGGQMLDLSSQGKIQSIDAMETMHRLKTGALITASAKLGAIAGNASKDDLTHITTFAENLGLAFQIQDDIFDHDGYVTLTNTDTAKQKLEQLHHGALQALDNIQHDTTPLTTLTQTIIQRSH